MAQLRRKRRLNEQLGLRGTESVLAKNEGQGIVFKDGGLDDT